MKSINLIILLDTLLRLCVFNPIDPVKEVIVVDAGTQETTQFGTKINNTDSLQAGERGHERIPERVIHARDPDTKTPVFVRFSTVLDSKDAPGTVRDVRGFAARFYT
ncbi:catalase-like domain-containing protein [Thamnidium elegans]|nr:catalase-like domain-containing protein [Thamnidium elegans]